MIYDQDRCRCHVCVREERTGGERREGGREKVKVNAKASVDLLHSES